MERRRIIRILGIVMGVIVTMISAAREADAATKTWTGSGENWNTAN